MGINGQITMNHQIIMSTPRETMSHACVTTETCHRLFSAFLLFILEETFGYARCAVCACAAVIQFEWLVVALTIDLLILLFYLFFIFFWITFSIGGLHGSLQ